MKWLHVAAYTLVWVVALNLGLKALFNLDVVETVLGGFQGATQVLYVLGGVSAVWTAYTHMLTKECTVCATGK